MWPITVFVNIERKLTGSWELTSTLPLKPDQNVKQIYGNVLITYYTHNMNSI